jgi:hypothetical protein
MCEAVDLSVVRLKRARYGFIGLEGLRSGRYRFLTADEVAKLRRLSQGGRVEETPKAAPAKPEGRKSVHGKKAAGGQMPARPGAGPDERKVSRAMPGKGGKRPVDRTERGERKPARPLEKPAQKPAKVKTRPRRPGSR